MTAAPPLLDVQALSKSYAGTRVVDGVSLAIAPGECLGVIGPNGAGKTTTIRLCLGLTAPDGGRIRYFVQPDGSALEMPRDALAIKARLGVVSQFDSLDPDFSCAENLQVFGRYFGLPRAVLAERVPRLLEFAALGHKASARPGELSGGMKRRLSLARALINQPELLLLDEPTTGLDPSAIRQFYDQLDELRQQGVTIVISSHILAELQQRVDRLALLASGTLRAEGTVAELRERTRMPVVFLARGDDAWHSRISAALGEHAGLACTLDGDGLLRISCPREQKMAVLQRLAAASPTDLHVLEPTLEDVYFELRETP